MFTLANIKFKTGIKLFLFITFDSLRGRNYLYLLLDEPDQTLLHRFEPFPLQAFVQSIKKSNNRIYPLFFIASTSMIFDISYYYILFP